MRKYGTPGECGVSGKKKLERQGIRADWPVSRNGNWLGVGWLSYELMSKIKYDSQGEREKKKIKRLCKAQPGSSYICTARARLRFVLG